MQVTSDPGVMLATATPVADWVILLPVIIPLLSAALLIMTRRLTHIQPILAFVATGLMGFSSYKLLLRVMAEGPLSMTMGNWFPPFGISFSADIYGSLLSVGVGLTGLAVVVASISEIDKKATRFGFYPLLLGLLAGVNGAFLTGDIFNLYVWFEVFVISSFGLIVLGGTPKQLDGALKYCFLNLIATTLFLIATGYLYGVFGTLNMADLSRQAAQKTFEGPLLALTILYILAFGMKAAAFPLFFWLPASYHTPKFAVSALFAGLLTKVGVYALFRTLTVILPVAIQNQIVQNILLVVALGTMLVGVLGALVQTDLRRLLSYLLMGGVGVMIVGLALATKQSVAASIFYMVHSIIAMTAIYLLCGSVFRKAGTITLGQLSGVYSIAPLLAGLFLLLCFAVAGLPPFSGVWPKIILVKEALASEAYITVGIILLNGLLSTIALGRAFALGFWRGEVTAPGVDVSENGLHSSAETDWYRLVPVLVLTLLVILIGVTPQWLFSVSESAAIQLMNPESYIRSVFGGA